MFMTVQTLAKAAAPGQARANRFLDTENRQPQAAGSLKLVWGNIVPVNSRLYPRSQCRVSPFRAVSRGTAGRRAKQNPP